MTKQKLTIKSIQDQAIHTLMNNWRDLGCSSTQHYNGFRVEMIIKPDSNESKAKLNKSNMMFQAKLVLIQNGAKSGLPLIAFYKGFRVKMNIIKENLK